METSRLIERSLANPQEALWALDKFQSEQSLINFIRLGWHALEPGTDFVVNWGTQAVCEHLEAVTRGEIKRLLMNVPPGTTKSMSTNVFWPSWEWGPMNLPHYRYVSFAHEKGLAIRDNVRGRALINSEWYQSLWGDRFGWSKDVYGKELYENTCAGWRQASPASGLTGKRGDRVIADDPHSVRGADSDAERDNMLMIFSETVPTRLNKMDESAIVVIMQRVHERDVSGLILTEELGYDHLMLPMEFETARRCYSRIKPRFIENPKKVPVYFDKEMLTWTTRPVAVEEGEDDAKREMRYNMDRRTKEGELLDPVRFPERSIIELKKALRSFGGSYAEAGQLQQRPSPRGGGMFKKDDWQYLSHTDGMSGFIVRGWDFAASDTNKAAYTVGAKILFCTDGRIVILDIRRFRKGPGAVETAFQQITVSDGLHCHVDIPQDPGQAGKSQVAAFAKLVHGHVIRSSLESGDKAQRAGPFAAQVELGNVYLLKAAWNTELIKEGMLFPNGVYKDQIDALGRAYAACLRHRDRPIGAGGQVFNT